MPQVKEFSRATWNDFEKLFGKHRGVRGGCWCTFNLCRAVDFERMNRDERRRFEETLVERFREIARPGKNTVPMRRTL